MAKFLKTTGVSYYLEQLINDANTRLVLISPFLKLNDRIKELLEYKNRLKKVDIRIIYGKNELQPEENNWLKQLEFVRASFCKNLHAKCYLNEKEALITSMNMYEFSQVNNNEMGIYVLKDEDLNLYNEINEEANRLIGISDEFRVTVEKVPKSKKLKTSKKKTNDIKSKNGYCIRCKKQIKLSPTFPYCQDCFKIWKKFGNEEYEEQYCHICGKDNKSTMIKPTCYPCYKKNKNVLEFSIS